MNGMFEKGMASANGKIRLYLCLVYEESATLSVDAKVCYGGDATDDQMSKIISEELSNMLEVIKKRLNEKPKVQIEGQTVA